MFASLFLLVSSVLIHLMASSEVPLKLFAYGTLMRGYQYHGAMQKTRFVGTALTVEKYGLFAIEYPFVASTVSTSCIVGEVYEVLDEDTLREMDEIEGHPTNYQRRPIKVIMDSGEEVDVQIYFNDREPTSGEGVEHILSGSFHDSKLAPLRRA